MACVKASAQLLMGACKNLTVRLAINMFSKEILLGAFGFMFTMLFHATTMGEKIMMVLPFAIRTGIILLGVVIAGVQALVFTLLSIVYIALAIEEHEDHEHGDQGTQVVLESS